MYNSNKVELCGQLVTDFTFDHESFGEKFYKAMLKNERNSGVADILPVVVSEKLLNMSCKWCDEFIQLRGQYRSWNKHLGDGKTNTVLYVFVSEAIPVWYLEDINRVELDGFIVKRPIYRKTPNGRQITDVMLAVNRWNGKTDYIPLIFWGRNATLASTYDVGTHISIVGRIQSREYFKRFDDDTGETRVAYEVSVRDVWEV